MRVEIIVGGPFCDESAAVETYPPVRWLVHVVVSLVVFGPGLFFL